MAKAKKKEEAKPSHDMVIRSINLEAPTEEVLREITDEKDLFVLEQAMVTERGAGRRGSVLSALERRGLELRRHGDGSEGPEYDLPGYAVKHPDNTPLFNTMNRTEQPKKNASHDQGDGAESVQKISRAERLYGELERQEAKRRMNTPAELFELQERMPNGSLVFRWGHMMPAQKEIKDETGKVKVRWRPSIIYLKACPRCGKENRPETGMFGRCYSCELDFVPFAKTEVGNNPSKYPGIELESKS